MKKPDHASVMRVLKRRYREKAASDKATPWESLVFTLLSARTRDDQTEIAFRRLLDRYPTIDALSAAKQRDVEAVLRTIGMYRNKAKFVIALAKRIRSEFGGKVPSDIDTLATLPGVGRKTANCVSVYAFGIPAVCVDTHVFRIVNRLGWARTGTPEKTEMALREGLPKRYWMDVNRVMVLFGRDICVPGRPKCWMCPVRAYCAFPKKTPEPAARVKGV